MFFGGREDAVPSLDVLQSHRYNKSFVTFLMKPGGVVSAVFCSCLGFCFSLLEVPEDSKEFL